jgi:hypothetical protein
VTNNGNVEILSRPLPVILEVTESAPKQRQI